MFQRIIVPLDGTRFAEAALAPARELARAFNSRILVVRAVPREELPLAAVEWDEAGELNRLGSADDYLCGIVEQLRAQAFKADLLLQVGEPGAGIAQAADLDHADVIVMTAHPHWKVDPLSKASTTLKVLARTAKTHTPLLAWRRAGALQPGNVRGDDSVRPPRALARSECPIVVALDGSKFAEGALEAAETLARTFDLPLVLARSIRQATRPGAKGGEERAATDYLQRVRRAVHQRGVRRVMIAVRHGTPLGVLYRVWLEFDGGLIVLASRGQGGFGGTFLGSTAARLIEEVEAPVLVVRPDLESAETRSEYPTPTTHHLHAPV
jgi:nucleotide-binding universal stress UspA family protein